MRQLGNCQLHCSTNFNFNVAQNALFLSLTNMNALLFIASRIEAAVAAYILVQPVPNLEEWRCAFVDEQVSAVMYGVTF